MVKTLTVKYTHFCNKCFTGIIHILIQLLRRDDPFSFLSLKSPQFSLISCNPDYLFMHKHNPNFTIIYIKRNHTYEVKETVQWHGCQETHASSFSFKLNYSQLQWHKKPLINRLIMVISLIDQCANLGNLSLNAK